MHDCMASAINNTDSLASAINDTTTHCPFDVAISNYRLCRDI